MSDPRQATTAASHTNRLARETSPYLLQHRHNPVDWYPWGPEAFERARREDKPIFLSVGYSTCYWCHVMERQSFENEAVAAEMNARFVNIKVDREERPDVDQLYMTAVQVLTRHGGWPMSVWLTPDLRPFYGGTYYPPTDQYGRPGFVTLLAALEDAYRNRRAEVEKSANQLVEVLEQLAEPPAPRRPVTVNADFIDNLIERSAEDYDPTFGGFGNAPKFPRETLLELLLVSLRQDPAGSTQSAIGNRTSASSVEPQSEIRKRLLHTLDALAAGGIRDQLGGGFHRYSTDARWLVPHFEIMLYDNAMLAWCYVEAFRQTGEKRYAAVARGVFDFVLREMTSPDGAFYTAFDAEVDSQEGLNYLWTPQKVEQVLGVEDARTFNRAYGLDRGPNFADPHHGSGVPDKNILFLPEPLTDELDTKLEPMRQKLYAARAKRKQPLLDTKVITSWNALMVRAFAYGGQVLNEPRYLDAAAKAAQFLLTRHRLPDGGLYRTSREGQAKYAGFLDDHAFLVQALLALRDAGAGDRQRWQDEATSLAAQMTQKFGDPDAGGFYFTDKDATDLIVRQKTAADSPLPSGNAVTAMCLMELGQPDAARDLLGAFAASMQGNGEGMSSMVQAALLYLRGGGEPFTVSAGERQPSGAPERPPTPQAVAAEVLSATATWATPTELRVTLRLREGFHVNAHTPGGGDVPLVPTTLTIEGNPPGVTIDYPPGEEQRLGFADTPVRVYGDETTIIVCFTSPPTGSPPRLRLNYQACNDNACLPPVTKSISVF